MGYRSGVPMGSDLPAPKGKAPSFAVYAVKDPDSGNLDRIQIVKGWAKNGQTFEKIYDIAWAGDRKPDPVTGKVPPIGSTVGIMKASYSNTIGAVELKAVWTDPEFDPALDAFYYARVLEIPTPRWTTQGPIESGFGWHLVWVESMTPARVPAFEEVEPEVRSEWVAEQRAEFKRQAFDAMKARYEVVLRSAPAQAAAGIGTLPVKEAP
jgi:Protein of unknown function (DUF3604)/PPIC-type PPIASE domain